MFLLMQRNSKALVAQDVASRLRQTGQDILVWQQQDGIGLGRGEPSSGGSDLCGFPPAGHVRRSCSIGWQARLTWPDRLARLLRQTGAVADGRKQRLLRVLSAGGTDARAHFLYRPYLEKALLQNLGTSGVAWSCRSECAWLLWCHNQGSFSASSPESPTLPYYYFCFSARVRWHGIMHVDGSSEI